MEKVSVNILRIDEKYADIELPVYTSPGAAGADIRAAVDEPVILQPGAFGLIPTNLKVEIPVGYELQVRPRSGLAAKNGVTVLNTPGTIDSDYRGEVKVILINFGKEPFPVQRGERIAQLVLSKVHTADFIVTESLTETERNAGGFGSSGVH